MGFSMSNNTKSIGKAIDSVAKYWGDMMPIMTMEESGELIQAISKLERFYKSDFKDESEENALKQNLVDEMGDAIIAIQALRIHYGIEDDAIHKRINKKLSKEY